MELTQLAHAAVVKATWLQKAGRALSCFHWRSKRYCMAMKRRMSSAYCVRMASIALESWNLSSQTASHV